ncbi:MAG: hypothetical protein AAFV49_13235, partial [Pseudomonadota bacterium]
MPTKRLTAKADIDHLKHQAKDLLRALRRGERAACQRVREFHPGHAAAGAPTGGAFTLGDAQLTIAREYGFASWPRLRAAVLGGEAAALDLPHHERIEDVAFRRAVDLIDEGDAAGLARHLEQHPGLAGARVRFEGGNYFREPALLEFVAENPIRHATLPATILDAVEVLLRAGPPAGAVEATLGLVASGRVARECGVQGALIARLVAAGAAPDAAMSTALGHGEFAAAEALIAAGAAVDLAVASALGRAGAARACLADAPPERRHRALALAAQHGHAEIVALLLAAGEAPS